MKFINILNISLCIHVFYDFLKFINILNISLCILVFYDFYDFTTMGHANKLYFYNHVMIQQENFD